MCFFCALTNLLAQLIGAALGTWVAHDIGAAFDRTSSNIFAGIALAEVPSFALSQIVCSFLGFVLFTL
jgi:uncharacterized membrane protein YeaQ/YmgE (transglycosylase-associated protein family)